MAEKMTWIQQVISMLDDTKSRGIVEWNANGDGVVIKDPVAIVACLARHFPKSGGTGGPMLDSFQRSLRDHGFFKFAKRRHNVHTLYRHAHLRRADPVGSVARIKKLKKGEKAPSLTGGSSDNEDGEGSHDAAEAEEEAEERGAGAGGSAMPHVPRARAGTDTTHDAVTSFPTSSAGAASDSSSSSSSSRVGLSQVIGGGSTGGKIRPPTPPMPSSLARKRTNEEISQPSSITPAPLSSGGVSSFFSLFPTSFSSMPPPPSPGRQPSAQAQGPHGTQGGGGRPGRTGTNTGGASSAAPAVLLGRQDSAPISRRNSEPPAPYSLPGLGAPGYGGSVMNLPDEPTLAPAQLARTEEEREAVFSIFHSSAAAGAPAAGERARPTKRARRPSFEEHEDASLPSMYQGSLREWFMGVELTSVTAYIPETVKGTVKEFLRSLTGGGT